MSEPAAPASVPRSILLQRVLDCLRDHCHDDTPERIARRLAPISSEVVEAALQALKDDRLVTNAGRHWQLTHSGWESARSYEA